MNTERKENIIITGATGFVGRAFTSEMISAGHTVVLLVRPSQNATAEERIHAQFSFTEEEWSRVVVLEVDLHDIQTFFQSEVSRNSYIKNGPITSIVHLAANLSFRSGERKDTQQTNIEGTKNVAWLAKELHVPLCHVSTAYVHGQRKEKLLESDLKASVFNNPYEESKFEAEKYLNKEGTKGLQYMIVRPSVIVNDIGISETRMRPFGYYAIVKSIFKLRVYLLKFLKIHPHLGALLGLAVVNDRVRSHFIPFVVSDTSLNLIPVHILTTCMKMILEEKDGIKNGTVFHLVNPKPLSLHTISSIAFDGVGVDMSIVTVPRWVVHSFYTVVRVLSYILSPLVDISKKFHYYGYYMTTTYNFDTTNIRNLLGGDEYNSLFSQQELYLQRATEHFVSELK